MSKRFLAVGLVLVVSLVAVATAIAGGSISSVSKSKDIASGETKQLTAKCRGKADAVAAGFKGVFKGDFMSGLTAVYPVGSRLDGAKATAGLVNVGMTAARATGYGYCDSGSVAEVKKTVMVKPDRSGSATAKCPRGKVPVSGGFRGSFSTTDGSGTIATSSSRSGSGWNVQAVAASGSEKTPITAYAYCAKDHSLKARSTKTVLRATGGTGSVKAANVDASCKSGERVVSGGYRPSPAATAMNGPITVSSYRKSASTWRISAAVAQSDAKIIAYAYCEKK